MQIETLIGAAREQGASDLHLEPGLPAAIRLRGKLRPLGNPIPAQQLLEQVKQLLGSEHWPGFLERRSADLSRTIQGVRCRINALQTARGVGVAIRLLPSFQATLERLNLHPDLRRLVEPHNGLVLVSGPTGCGKSSTMAALIQEINLTEPRHIITIENPIEFNLHPRRAYLRQRQVGRDTPSFEQALLDALREDPDVLMVGEMREPEVMRLTLSASETGHLVLATVHSSSCVEALQRVVGAFPAEIQSGVRVQLADCLVAVVCQRLRYRPDLQVRLPECEILTASHAVKNFIRTGDFFKILSVMETGAEHGMWTFQRYQTWMKSRSKWFVPTGEEPSEEEPVSDPATLPAWSKESESLSLPKKPSRQTPSSMPAPDSSSGAIEIEPVDGGWDTIARELGGG